MSTEATHEFHYTHEFHNKGMEPSNHEMRIEILLDNENVEPRASGAYIPGVHAHLA